MNRSIANKPVSLHSLHRLLQQFLGEEFTNQRTRRSAGMVLLLIACAGISAAAQAPSHFALDAGQSTVHFSLTGAHEVNGTFHVSSGSIDFAPAAGTMSGKVTVDATSGDSGNDSRDKKMKSDQLKVTSYPSVTFEPTGFSGTLAASGTSQIQVKGTFTLLGQPHVITVPMTVQINSGHCSATGSFVVPYVQWGVKDPSIFMLKVAKEVKIDLDLKGQISPVS